MRQAAGDLRSIGFMPIGTQFDASSALPDRGVAEALATVYFTVSPLF